MDERRTDPETARALVAAEWLRVLIGALWRRLREEVQLGETGTTREIIDLLGSACA